MAYKGCMRIETIITHDETYTFTPDDGSEEINIWSGRLRKALLQYAMDKVIYLTFPVQPMEEIYRNHGIEQAHMATMTAEEAAEPVIVGLWPDGTHILIDGAHRRAWHALRGNNVLRGWAVPYELWNKFTFKAEDVAGGFIDHSGMLNPHRMKP